MQKEKKIIIIGVSTTIIVLLLTILIMFIVYNSKAKNELNNNVNSNSYNTNNTLNNNTNLNNKNDSQNNNTEEKKVTIYLFRGQGCHFCENAIDFLESIADKYSYLEIKSFEVWNNNSNKDLMNKVSEQLNIEKSNSVPLIIIGTNYARRGYAEGMNEDILKAIADAYTSENYEDVIEKVIESNNLKVNGEIIK